MSYDYDLRVELGLSSDLPAKAEKELESIFKEINESLLKGSKVLNWKTSKDKLVLRIISGRNQEKPHTALLRLRKVLAQKLGKEFKIGIRGFKFKEYSITEEHERPAKDKITVPFASNLEIKGNTINFQIKEMEEDFVEKGAVERLIKLIKEKIDRQYYEGKERFKIIYQTPQKKMLTKEDPTKLMVKQGWIRRTMYRNQWVWGPEITAIAEGFKKLFVKELYKPLGFNQMIFPKYESFEVMKRSGHLKGLYQGSAEFYFVAPPKTRDPKFWEDMCDWFKVTNEVNTPLLMTKLDPPQGCLSFAQCPPFWQYPMGKTVDVKTLPLKVYDWSGPTYRYESGGAHGLERVDELHRIETLFFGTKKQVIDIGLKVREKLLYIFDKVLDFEMKAIKVIPWWLEQAGEMAKEDDVTGTVDMEVYLPYRGDRSKSEWMELQNISIIGTHYPEDFSVKASTGEELWSGCAGGSFERFITTLIAQKGTDTKDWPEKLVKQIGEIPRGLRFF